jgi:hypothetical protein
MGDFKPHFHYFVKNSLKGVFYFHCSELIRKSAPRGARFKLYRYIIAGFPRPAVERLAQPAYPR